MSLWDNMDEEPWDKNVPPDLIPAIKFLRKSFERAHSTFGILVTMPLCYSQLHDGTPKSGFEGINEYIKSLTQLKSWIGPAATQRFHELLSQGTLPAIFKGFFDFYLEGVKVQAILTFNELLGIGRANEARLNRPHVEWAESQTQQLIRSHRHNIRIWVRDVCDEHQHDPNEDWEEQIDWKKWQAPSLLIMKPSRFRPYDSTKVWERNDPETSSGWLDSLADHYVLILDIAVKDAAGNAALALAKQTKQNRSDSAEAKPQAHQDSSAATQPLPAETSEADATRKTALLRRIQTARPEGCFRTEEAAVVLDVSERTINRKVNDGELTQGPTRGTVTARSVKQVYEASFGNIE